MFERADEALEIITSNRRPLERAFGVDLIYLNTLKKNIVMVQYKMLERMDTGDSTDWIYRPDDQLELEIERMSRFRADHAPRASEYRINSEVFYLRFVRRDASLGRSAVTMPLDHFEALKEDPSFRGPRGAFRVSYGSLNGRYLRQEGFLVLIRSGYVGAYAEETNSLAELVESILKSGRALVAAVQSSS